MQPVTTTLPFPVQPETHLSASPAPPVTPAGLGSDTEAGLAGEGGIPVLDLGRMEYKAAYEAQCDHLEEVLASRGAAAGGSAGRILLVEHDPVVTIGRRPGAANHLMASPDLLAQQGVAIVETDRGGDITYHGPGQLVCYPIIDLSAVKWGLHAYMRTLEEAVINTCSRFGLAAERDEKATGVWVPQGNGQTAKICAMGVRVRRWITLHGLALNVTTNLDHFGLIVPCGLAGRPVTSLSRELAARGWPCPGMDQVKRVLAGELTGLIAARARNASDERA